MNMRISLRRQLEESITQVHLPAMGSLMRRENNIVNLYKTNGREDQPFYRVSKAKNSVQVWRILVYLLILDRRGGPRVCFYKSYTVKKFGVALARNAEGTGIILWVRTLCFRRSTTPHPNDCASSGLEERIFHSILDFLL